tara:strand:+ start:208 stop:399 length:192 start_codon:yes stop_codon:yes gene_type:complete
MQRKRQLRNSVSLQITKDYHRKLEMAVMQLSTDVGERVPMTHLMYELIDNHLEQAVKSLKNKY